MEKKKKIEQEVAKTLQYLEKKENIACSPYFQARLMARIKVEEKNKSSLLIKYFTKPALISTIFVAFILINMSSMLWALKESIEEKYDRDTYLSTFAQEYSLNTNYTDLITLNR